jgi:tetratricopeptide (TPR) repeat protein
MGNLERALTASMTAYDTPPNVREGREELLLVAHAARHRLDMLERVRRHIDAIGERSTDLGVPALIHLAEVEHALGEGERALTTIALALARSDESEETLAAAAAIYLDRGDYEHAASFKKRLAEAIHDDDRRFERLIEAGEIWAQKAQNVPMAALAYEDALVLRPKDSRLLHTLMWAYGELACWEKLQGVLRAVVDIDKDPVKKAKGLFTMAQIAQGEMGDGHRAAELLEECIAVDPSRIDAFERIVRIYTELRDWNGLEKSYRRMLHRTPDQDIELRHALFHQLGLIYRDRLGDASRAIEAFRAAGALKPSEENRTIVTELYVVSGRVAEAIGETRELLKDPGCGRAPYATLYELFLRTGAFDQAWCAVSVLAHLGSVNAEQRKFHDDYPPLALSYVPGRITRDAWRSHVLDRDLDPALTALFAIMGKAVMRVRANMRGSAAVFGDPLTAQHSYNAGALIDAVRNAKEILATEDAPLYARKSPPAPLSVVAAGATGLVACTESLDTLSRESLVFLVGKRLTELRPELFGRSVFPTVSEMTTAVATAFRLVRGEAAPDASTQAVDRDLVGALTREERGGLHEAVGHAAATGGKLDVKRWAQRADASSSRAGLLLCGHVEYAKRALVQDGQRACDLPLRARVHELCAFAVSDAFAELRAAIGVGVSTTA